MKFVYALIVFAVVSVLFIVTYVLNKRTPKPENCKELPDECKSCKVEFCAIKNQKVEKESE